MGNRCIQGALIVLGFAVFVCVIMRPSHPTEALGETVQPGEVLDMRERVCTQMSASETGQEAAAAQIAEETVPRADLTDAFDVILTGATKEFIAGYVIDETFLMWLAARYGDALVEEMACCVLEGQMNPDTWYDRTGNSIHVLWLQFCRDNGFQNYQLENVVWQDTREREQAVFAFTGDFNFAEDWCTTEYMQAQPGGLTDCISADLLEEMRGADVLLMNNEFTYMQEGKSEAIPGKAYTFRADPERVSLLKEFGADAVTLANNHVFDYGETGLLDTMHYLEEAGIPYLGAGKNLEEASKILYYVVNGRKVGIVSATQIERTSRYTREATAEQSGVLKTLNPEIFLDVIRKAADSSDYVIAVVHWGTEGNLIEEYSQRILTAKYAQAGADVVIGGHPHRLQGVGYIEGIPVAYSLGNFWFSDGTLYTSVAEVVIADDRSLRLRMLPCVQRGMVTSLLTDSEEKDGFYHYLASVSDNIGLDTEGNVYDKRAEDYTASEISYDSDTSRTEIDGARDNEGYAIDIVGNLK